MGAGREETPAAIHITTTHFPQRLTSREHPNTQTPQHGLRPPLPIDRGPPNASTHPNPHPPAQ
jgi:hypothetical protein